MRVPLQLQDIDFDSLKSSLKAYMLTKPKFADIDFEGSNINVILDLLAANGQIHLFYEHMALNESFLNSALLKSSVISKAKELGYIPRSSSAAKATVNVALSNILNNPAGIAVPRGTRFTGKGTDGNTYTFVTLNSTTLLNNGTSYTASNIEISEGKLYTVEYEHTLTTKTFRIPSVGCDTSSMIVTVKTNAGTTYYTEFFKADSILGLNSTSKAYYLQQSGKGEFEIYFGDGKASAALAVGNIININYLVTNGDKANSIQSFDLATSLYAQSGTITQNITTVLSSFGGAQFEDIESIRDNAKRTYVTQYRSVVETDYEQNILLDFPAISSVAVWGGENNIPKTFGKVFCSVVTSNLQAATNSKKTKIISSIKKRNIINIAPIIVDPQILTIILSGYIRVDRFMTNSPPESIIANALSKIAAYNNSYLRKFKGTFQYSELSKLISNVDQSISGVVINFTCEQPQTLIMGVASDYSIKFFTEVRPNLLSSSTYKISGNNDSASLVDVSGNIYHQFVSGATTYLSPTSVGTVNYSTGEVQLKSFKITPVDNTNVIKIAVTPANAEVFPQFNQILNIDINKTNISVVTN